MLRFDLKRENPGLYKQGLISVNFLQHKATLRTVLPDWVANPPQSIPSSLPFSLPDFHQVCLTFHHYLFMLLQVEGKLKSKVSLEPDQGPSVRLDVMPVSMQWRRVLHALKTVVIVMLNQLFL